MESAFLLHGMGSERADHKYSKREWKNGKWVYYYDEPKSDLVKDVVRSNRVGNVVLSGRDLVETAPNVQLPKSEKSDPSKYGNQLPAGYANRKEAQKAVDAYTAERRAKEATTKSAYKKKSIKDLASDYANTKKIEIESIKNLLNGTTAKKIKANKAKRETQSTDAHVQQAIIPNAPASEGYRKTSSNSHATSEEFVKVIADSNSAFKNAVEKRKKIQNRSAR